MLRSIIRTVFVGPLPGPRRHARRGAAFTVVEAAVAGALVTLFLTSLFALNSNMMHLLRASAEAANASQLLQQRVEQARIANWSQLTDPVQYTNGDSGHYNFADKIDIFYSNLPGLTETVVVSPYAVPPATPAPGSPPPYVVTRDGTNNLPAVYTPTQFNADGTVFFQPDGTLPNSASKGYSPTNTNALAQQGLIRVDLIAIWPSFARTRTRTLTTVVSRWGISK